MLWTVLETVMFLPLVEVYSEALILKYAEVK